MFSQSKGIGSADISASICGKIRTVPTRTVLRKGGIMGPLRKVGLRIAATGENPGHWPAGGCHSSTLFPSGSMTQANFPYSESSTFSSTLQPSSRKTLTNP